MESRIMHRSGFRNLTVTVLTTSLVVAVFWLVRDNSAQGDDKGAKSNEKISKKETPLQHFMRKKMDASSLILEGLVMENATYIKEGGNALLDMSKAETFQVLTDKEYRLHNREFRDATKRMIDAAEKESYDKVALAWFDVTISCVDCHDHVRKTAPAAPETK
jgi:hypothetical protein